MKKTVLVIALTVVMVLAFASAAFAEINHSGQEALGLHASPAGALPTAWNIPATVAPWETGGSMNAIYVGWDPTLRGNAQQDPTLPDFAGNSPHGNYTTTTVKCAVCHSIHYAGPAALGNTTGDFTVASGGNNADTLLRMKASEACIMCHATAGMAVNGRPVYDGIGPTLVNNTGGDFNTGHFAGPNCSECHTTVHGVGADNTVASLNGYLLKKMSVSNIQGTGANSTDMYSAMDAIEDNAINQGFAAGTALGAFPVDYATVNDAALREVAVGVFCAECHLGAYANGADAASVATNIQGSSTAAFSGHRLVSAVDPNWNSDGSISSGSRTLGQVAWLPSTNCKSCHAATDRYGNIGFPHSWGGAKMWLMTAADAGSSSSKVGWAAGYTGADASQLQDGVCLRCHIASGGSAGVGITF